MSAHQVLTKELGSLVHTARFSAGLTQAEVARRARTKQPSIARAEREGCEVALAEKLIRACGYELTFYHLGIRNGTMSHTSFLG